MSDLNPEEAPVLQALRHYVQDDRAPFYTPGHKRGLGIDPEFRQLLGGRLFQLDLPDLPGLDVPLAAAERLAALAWGADRSWFLVNGSTGGLAAMLLATCRPGDRVLIGRNCHQSAIAAIVAAGVTPIYLATDWHADLSIDCGVAPATLAAALQKNSAIRAVMLVSPNYFGVSGDLSHLVAIAHQYDVPVLVDAAHGAHLGFHPDLPMSAVQAGADLVVQSVHKTLSGLTQASILHLRGDRVDADRVARSLQLLQTTSPNLLLLASLDAARRQMARHGKDLLEATLQLARYARSAIAALPPLRTVDRRQIPTLDETRLTILTDGLGLTGFAADEIFCEELGVVAEMPTLRHLVFILSLGNQPADIDRLLAACRQLVRESRDRGSGALPPWSMTLPPPVPVMTPRDAFFADGERIAGDRAVGRICKEMVCPYPPGIPILCPGEAIAAEHLAYLHAVSHAGGAIVGCADPSLQTMEVVTTCN